MSNIKFIDENGQMQNLEVDGTTDEAIEVAGELQSNGCTVILVSGTEQA